MSRAVPEALRRRRAAEALRLYARLLVEHERVRRLPDAKRSAGARSCQPCGPAWRPLHDLAFFEGQRPRSAALAHFCARFPDAGGPRPAVPCRDYLAALRAAIELAGDRVVRNGADPPWRAGRSRAPQSPEAFEAICRALRDRDDDADEFGSLAAILDGAEVPSPPAQPTPHQVAFDVPGKVLIIDGRHIPLPEGREYGFLRLLVSRHKAGEVTPIVEHGHDWKSTVDNLRARIRKATGRNLLAQLVVAAKGVAGGYRLNPNVAVLHDREVRLQYFSSIPLDALAHPSGRKPRGRDLRGESEDD